MGYDIDEHRHRFAIWAASRAAQIHSDAKLPALRKALEECGICGFLESRGSDRLGPQEYDEIHRKWCEAVIEVAGVAFGRAAKLIAMYLKIVVVLGPGGDTELARVAHPPIDSILLSNLVRDPRVSADQRRRWSTIKWTKLSREEYGQLIAELRHVLDRDEAFWKLERYFTVTRYAKHEG